MPVVAGVPRPVPPEPPSRDRRGGRLPGDDARGDPELPSFEPVRHRQTTELSAGFINHPAGVAPVTRPSRDRVEAALRSLRETDRRFDVHQTSVALAPSSYETALRDGLVDAAIRVENAAGEVLAVRESGWREPRVRLDHREGTDLVEAARTALAEATGVVCRVTGLREVSVVTIHDESDASRPPKFALDVRLSGRYEGGEPRGGVVWRDRVDERAVV